MKLKKQTKMIMVIFFTVLLVFSMIYINNRRQKDGISHIVNDGFVIKVSNEDLNYEKLKNIYYFLEEQKTPFPFNKKVILEQITLKNELDEINFIKTSDKVLEFNMSFSSNLITLDNDIKIGINKSLIERKFNLKNISDEFKIAALEGDPYFVFTFKDNKLVKIEYQVKYID